MAKKKATPPKAVRLVWADTAARGDVRKWRLHACGCSRVNFPKRVGAKWLRLLDLAERYADGEATEAELRAGRTAYNRGRKPAYVSSQSGDFSLAFYESAALERTWQTIVIAERREYTPDTPDFAIVLDRFRVLEELIGPDPLPTCDPAWRTETVLALARGMYTSRDFSAMPILADALQDAGCDSELLLTHCRDQTARHVRGCWALDAILAKAPARRT